MRVGKISDSAKARKGLYIAGQCEASRAIMQNANSNIASRKTTCPPLLSDQPITVVWFNFGGVAHPDSIYFA